MKVNLSLSGKDVEQEFKNIELLPCPFCGSRKPEVLNTHTPSYWVECDSCDAQISGRSFWNKKSDHFIHEPPIRRQRCRQYWRGML